MNMINQSEVNVTFNSMFKINCSVESYPPAMVHWEEDSKQVSGNTVGITDTMVYQEVTVDTSTCGTIIAYTCVAVNEINGVDHFANNSINVIIQGKMKISCQIAVNSMGSRTGNSRDHKLLKIQGQRTSQKILNSGVLQ